MYALLKGLVIVIASIIASLLILFVFIYLIYLIKTIIYISALAIHEPSVQYSIIIFIVLSSFLLIYWYNKINWYLIFLYIFSFAMIAFIMNIYFIEKRISNLAIKKYNVEPSYVDINYNIDDGYREAHAVLYVKENSYYWSFKKNDFILNTNPNLHL